MAAKRDLKQELKHLYSAPTGTPVRVEVPPLPYLMIDGVGDPNTAPAYHDALETLYPVAYALKSMSKQDGIDFVVMPLEGLWWTDDMREFDMERRNLWRWTAMILQPDHITAGQVEAAREQVRRKKKPVALDLLRFETLHEGQAAQIMHRGPYAAEGPTVAALHAWIEAQGCTFHGERPHHEIYLSDPRRVAPDRMKTIIRQPVRSGQPE